MRKHRFLKRLLPILLLASILLGSLPPITLAQDGPDPEQDLAEQQKIEQRYAEKAARVQEQQERKITAADRKAAAERSAEAGFLLNEMGAAGMAMPGAAPRYFSHPNYANSPLPGNSVAEWNAIAQEILQPTPMPGMPMPMGGISMATAFVYLAYMQAAVYDALVAIEGGYQPYNLAVIADPTASRDAAVAAAAYTVLKHYLPTEPTLDGKYADALAAIPNSPEKTAGIAIGLDAANAIIALRTGDGLLASTGYTVPAPGPGVWEPTMMLPGGGAAPPVDPWMAELQPFLRATPEQYRPAPPPALNDPQYLLDLAEVKAIGGAMSISRTLEQTEVAVFWTTNMVIQTNQAYRQIAANRNLNLIETARLMALGNMAATDSLIATFDAKYIYNFWRPVTAIQHTNPDGSYSATTVNTWMPAVMTPNFPEYVAGHGSFISAQAEVYTTIFGTPNIEVDLESTVTGSVRHFATAADLRTEIVNARTWGGLHFRTSSELAVAMGQQMVVDAVATHFGVAASRSEHATVSGGIRKFVDGLPGLTAANANNLGQYLPVAVPDTTTYPGADYYEIAVVQYREKMHSDLPETLLRGYVQVSTAIVPGEHVTLTNALLDGTESLTGFFGVTPPHYLGPTIVAAKDRPVRIKFYNLLPTGIDGDLFIPVDTTVMGAGMGPNMYGMEEMDPQNPMCGVGYDMLTGDRIVKDPDCYAENRATLHLHGGITPWISDGTPHQWITPAGENTSYPQGVSVQPVPDMSDSGDPDDGVMTFYYTNQQSARLMFYHDHSWGITRLNVYAGEAAPYIITDEIEQSLIAQGLIPDAASTIPLVVQDKTFVPSASQLAVSDETWDATRWGDVGNLWLPHVYSPAQNPGDSSGVNQFGRWAYGPWFWPPTGSVDYPPVDNPYYDPSCDPDVQWCEPPQMPGTPYNSMGMEAFMDTPVVNGTVYPVLEIEPKAYRFRVLNAANDRFFNLSFYQAVDANGVLCDLSNPAPAAESTGVACTEVLLNPGEVAAALDDPTIFPTPQSGTEGPSWIQIGTEGGFLPAPTVIPAQYTTWVNDPTVFNAGNVDLHSLLIGPAERADVIVDFSQFAGQTLILYNDAPAAFPARDPRYDYYTGNGDYRDTGGAPSTLPGYGPNTRTVMQIKVAAAAPAPSYNLTALQSAFKATSLGGQGVFQNGQHPIIVGQGAYNSAYGTSFPNNGPYAGLVQIFNTTFTFKTLLNNLITMPLQPKQIQDEMGEAFDPDYGRMSGFLGLETPNPQAGMQNMLLYGFAMPPTEVLRGIQLPPGVELSPLAVTDDGTQLWKITHNGVDTHPIHFHLFDVQLINRVGWDGIIRRPEANELGWKDTVRISPLEDTIVALRPLIPEVPWDLPNSVRLMDPSMPEGAILGEGMPVFDPSGQPVQLVNRYVNYGWEYVWHCHILSHEEMDMMRSIVVGVRPVTPTLLYATVLGTGAGKTVSLEWVDNSLNETAFTIQRATAVQGPWTDVGTVTAGTTIFSDAIGDTTQGFVYRIVASNTVGDTSVYAAPSVGFPNTTMVSEPSNLAATDPALFAPSNLTATATSSSQIVLNWTDNSSNEISFKIERSLNGVNWAQIVTVGANVTTYTSAGLICNTPYSYRVRAAYAVGFSPFSNTAAATTFECPPAAPSGLTATAASETQINLSWTDNSSNETGFRIERSLNGTTWAQIATVGAGVTTYQSLLLTCNTPYYYRVRASSAVGFSPYSNVATATTAVCTNLPPSGLSATAVSGSRINLSWADNSANEVSFKVERSLNGVNWSQIATVAANGTSFASTGLICNTPYYYRVRAAFAVGYSAFSNIATATTLECPPAAPSGLTATAVSGTRIDLSWADNSSNETNFRVERSLNGTTWAQIATVSANVTTFFNTSLTCNYPYYYRVRAYNSGGFSSYSNVASATTMGCGASAPDAILNEGNQLDFDIAP